MHLVDKFGRAITDLRISITDRCNYKCLYCRARGSGDDFDTRFPNSKA
jgi:GTP 3',8-cyclase